MTRLKHILATAGLLFCCVATYAQTISNKGKEFWVGYGHHQFMENRSNTMNMVIYLSTEELGATVTVTLDSSGSAALPPGSPGGPWRRTYTLPPFTVIETVNIPKGTIDAGASGTDPNYDATLWTIGPPAGTGGAGIFRGKGIHIESTAPIVAYAHIWGSTSSGATMLMPVVSWGYSYMSLNSKQSYASNCYNWMYVVASRDNTVIEVTPSVKTRAQDRTGLIPGVTKQVTLMKGQIYQVIGANLGADANGNGGASSDGLDLSGTIVKSVGGSLGNCFPIAVFAGSSRTANPITPGCGSGGGDNDNQQLFPFHAWGKKYATVPFSNSTTPTNFTTNTFKIGVMDPTTVVKRNGNTLTGLINNKYYTYTSSEPDYIEADKPIMVTQFMTGGGCLNTPGNYGDPEMVVIAPIEQAISQVGFYRNTKESIQVNYVTLIVKQEGLPSLRIDNSFTFDAVIDHPKLPGYKIVIKRWSPAAKAQVFIKCDSSFNAFTYGEGSVESYGYSAGAKINNLNSITGLHNTPDTSATALHQYTCVNTPVKVSILMRYRTLKLNWDLSGIPASCYTMSPPLTLGAGSTFLMDPADNYLVDSNVYVNGIRYYQYTLPTTFTFSCANVYDIPVVSTAPGIDNCGSNETLYVSIDIKARPNINFTLSHPTQCVKDSIYLTGPVAGLSGTTLPMLLSQYTWNWKSPVGSGHAKDTTIILSPGSDTIKLTAVTTLGCLSDTVTKVINVYTPPTTVLTALPDTVCLGQNITFTQTASYGAAGVPMNNYYWDFGDNVTANTTPPTNTQVHNYSAFNTYTAKGVVRVSGLCIGDTSYKIVYVGSQAKVGFTYPTTCLPSTGVANFVANATAQGGATITSYQWNFGDPASGSNNTANGQSVSHTYSPTADSFQVSLHVVTSTGCTGDTAIWVNANIAPSLAWSASANFNAVCQDVAPFSLAFGTVTNGVTGTPKYTGPGIDSAGIFNPQTAGPGTHTIRYTFTSNKGCVDFKDTTITVNAKPAKPAVVTPVAYCQNATALPIAATAAAGNTLTYYDNVGLTGGSATAPTPSTATAGTVYYYINQTSGAGCKSDTSIITVNVTPVIANNSITADQTLCSGTAAATLNGSTPTGGTGTYNYQWQSSPDGTNWTDIVGATSSNYDPGTISTTTRYRRIIVSGLCSDISNVVTITIVPALTNTNINGVPPVCEGIQPALIDGQNAGAFTYTWESSPDNTNWTVIAGATGEDYQPPVLSPGTYYYRRKVVNGPCSATSNVVTVTVNPNANGSITAPSAICQYNSADITFTSSAGTAPFSIAYTITNPSGITTSVTQTGVSNTGTFNVVPTGSAGGTYTVTLTSITNSNGCIRTTGLNSVNIAVTATPIITIDPAGPICEGATVPMTAHGATTYSWSGTNLITNTGATVTANPTISTIYTVTGTTNGCNGTQTVNVTVNPKPAKPSVTTPVAYCQNGTAVAISATASAGNTLTYYNNAGLTGGSTTAPTPSTATAGTVYYYITQTTGAGCESDTSIITVNITPSIAGNTISSDQTLCSGSPSTLLNSSALSGGTGTYSYQWQSSPDGTNWNNIPGATNISYDPAGITTTTKYRRLVTSGLCSDISNVITITVIPALTNTDISGTQTVCENVQPNPIDGQNTGGGVIYVWQSSPDGTTWTTIAGANGEDYQPPVLSATTRYRRIVSAGPCTDTSSVVTVTVTTLANGSITAPSAICQYNSADITFTSSAGTAPFSIAYTITNPSGITTSVTQTGVSNTGTFNVIPTGSAGGTYTVTLTSITNSNGCIRTTGLNSVNIVVTATPIITIDPAGPICEGATVPMAAHGATTYSWSGTNLITNTGATVTANPTISTIYTVTGTTNGCNGTQTVNVTVNPKPAKPSVTTPVAYCQNGTAVAIIATASAGNTLTYYNNAGLTGGSTTAPTPSTATAGTVYYYITQTTGAGCESDTSIITVTIYPVISNNTVSADQTLCAQSAATPLTGATLAGGYGTYTYQWQQSTDGGSSWTNIAGATNATYDPGTLPATTKFRRIVNSGLCSDISNEVSITMLPLLANYDITGNQPPICEGTAPTGLDGQSTPGAISYVWQSSADGVNWTNIPGATNEDYQPPVLSATTSYRRIVNNGVCSATSSVITITVNPLANGTISAPAAICEYESADMVLTTSVGTAPFDIWYTIIDPSGTLYPRSAFNLSNGAVLALLATGSAPGNYTIRLDSIRSSNGCVRRTGLGQIPVIVKATPIITFTPNPIPAVCDGDSATLNASGATTYLWSGAGLSATTGNPVKAAPAASTTYTVTGTTNGCSATRTMDVIVNPRPVVNIVVADNNICLNEQGIFSATSSIASGSIQNYYWDFDNGNTQITTGTTATPQSYNPHRTYIVKLYAISDQNCSSVTDTAHIIVNPMPVADFSMPSSVCIPGDVQFTNNSSLVTGGSLSYNWNFGDATTSSTPSPSHTYVGATMTSSYIIKLTATSAAGCATDITKTFSSFFDKPLAKFDVAPDTLCQGNPNAFADLSTAPNSTIRTRLWMFGDGSTDTTAAPVKTYTNPGNFQVKLQVENMQGCMSDTAKQVLVYLQPVIDAGPNFVVPQGTTITFGATANSPSLAFAWTTITGNTPNDPGKLKPTVIADQDGQYMLTATGQGNCTASDFVTIKVLKPIGIPNAFSPNKDGINDTWNLENLRDYPRCTVEIYNRYGQIVFQTFGYTKPWDGTYKGKDLPVGTYYYIIDPKNGFEKITGYVVILR
jgi:gliding motility-associated-like protein